MTVTPNPALDLTYTVDGFAAGHVHRVRSVEQHPGGKGVNVARVLHALGRPVAVAGLVGGAVGEVVCAGLDLLGLDRRFTQVAGETRRTVTVVDERSGRATVFNEPGPTVTPGDWARLVTNVSHLLAEARVLVCSGSLPPGLPDDALVPIIEAARRLDVATVVDTSGPPLRAAVAAGPNAVKPNADELAAATGIDDPGKGARVLRGGGSLAVIASLGPAGLLALTAEGTYAARLDRPLIGNPTGAGDSVVAAVAAGLHDDRSWSEIVRAAVALAGATVLAPVAGEFDAAAYARLRRSVSVDVVEV